MIGIAEDVMTALQNNPLLSVLLMVVATLAGMLLYSLTQVRALRRQREELETRVKSDCENLDRLRKKGLELQLELDGLTETHRGLMVHDSETHSALLNRTTELLLAKQELDAQRHEMDRLEQQLIHAQKMESLGTLVGGIAHDFNNILAIIVAHASLLEVSTDATVAGRAAAIQRSATRGASLVRQLLTFARKREIRTELVYINDIVVELRELLNATLPATVTLQAELAENLPPIAGERTLVYQALLNLCVNARDAMPQGGILTISTSLRSGEMLRSSYPDATEPQYVLLEVADSGVGIAEDILERVFEPYYSTKEPGKGTGLGLAVTQNTVRGHNGFIGLESKPGEGTRFSLYFPAINAPTRVEEVDPLFVAEIEGGTETILVIEDEEDLLDILSDQLRAKGYKVLTATNGVDAVNLVSSTDSTIDLVVSDIGLPGMDGIRAYRYIQQVIPGAAAVFASGYLDDQVRDQLRAGGVEHMLQKPYAISDVLMNVRSALNARRLRGGKVRAIPA